jgi:hypothetical protein
MTSDTALPLEHFIQAVQSQLDNAQTAMAMKARNLELPLTFAIKDITLDLRAHVDFSRSEIRIRPAGPGDGDASMFHLVFTTITRTMIEENAVALGVSQGDQSIDELTDELTDEERRRLEWGGIRTVSKLREVQERGADRTVERITGLPTDRLRKALARSSAPMIADVTPLPANSVDMPARLRLRGRNLARGGAPIVTLDGQPVSVLSAADGEVIVVPDAGKLNGELRLATSADQITSTAFDLRAWPAESAPASNGHRNGDGGGVS